VLEIKLPTPMIDSTSSFDRASRAQALPGDLSDSTSKRVVQARDTLYTNQAQQLSAALAGQPEVRPEVVARGSALAADPNYPSAAIISKVAGMILNSPDPSEDQS